MNETKLEIKLFGDPALRKKVKSVKEVTEDVRDTLSQMSRLMYASGGIGLASPQVGLNLAMITVDIGSGLYKLINPKIVNKEGSQVLEEGCLSIPSVCIKVKRARKVKVKAWDEFAKPVVIEAQDLLAAAFQHEIDHLKGRLIIDYASFFAKLKITRRLEELSRKSGIPQEAGKKRSKDEELSDSETKSRALQL